MDVKAGCSTCIQEQVGEERKVVVITMPKLTLIFKSMRAGDRKNVLKNLNKNCSSPPTVKT
eukprot:796586-Amphidinium_carterae.1